jgi:phage terminase large subunit
VLPQLGASWVASESRWVWPSGATLELGYCETLADAQRYQGQEYDWIGFDEIGQLKDEQVWTFLSSRCRGKDATIRRAMRCTANPGGAGHAWVKRRFVTPCGSRGERVYADPATGLTRAYVPAKVWDNPAVLKNSPEYIITLQALPAIQRRQLLDGDWDAAAGLAFDELPRDDELVPAFTDQNGDNPLPRWWATWSSFDWGYNHPFAAGAFAQDGDGTVYVLDSVHGRRLLPEEIAERIAGQLPAKALQECYAGHDCWNKVRARGGQAPTIADVFAPFGVLLVKANIDRVLGWTAVRRGLTTAGGQHPPRLVFCDTPGNRKTLDCLRNMVVDPDRVEDVLKVDADPVHGQGGDDAADMIRYGLALAFAPPTEPRPPRPADPFLAPTSGRDPQSEYEDWRRTAPPEEDDTPFGQLPAGF